MNFHFGFDYEADGLHNTLAKLYQLGLMPDRAGNCIQPSVSIPIPHNRPHHATAASNEKTPRAFCLRRGDLDEDDPDFVCCADVRDSGLRRHSDYRAYDGDERDYEGQGKDHERPSPQSYQTTRLAISSLARLGICIRPPRGFRTRIDTDFHGWTRVERDQAEA
jgi:hypothetical protein